MRKTVLFFLGGLSFLAIVLRFGTNPLIKALNLEAKAGIQVESNIKAKLILNDKDMGFTPFKDENLKEGKYLVSLKDPESSNSADYLWQGHVDLNSGTLTVVNREIAGSSLTSSGEVINLKGGNGVTVVSIPSSAQVFLDGKDLGRTPVSVSNVSPGEHQFLISKENFLKRSIRATSTEGYNLTINVDLAVSEADLTKLATTLIEEESQVIVKMTPTGFLRVRTQANVNSDEVSRVKPGDILILLEQIPNWNRIRLPDGKEGYVSSTYTEKKSQ